MKHNYHERKQNRIDHAKEMEQKKDAASDALYKRATDIASCIPMGQPILVGHHSEKRHRKDIERIDNAMRGSVEAGKKAAYYAGKAVTIESNTAIASDNPDALDLLKEKLQKLKTKQEFMKAANKCIKGKNLETFLKIPGATEATWLERIQPNCFGVVGYDRFELTNNGAVIRNTEQRIKQLESVANLTTKKYELKGVRVVQNVEANRVQLFFPSKPSEEIRRRLHKEFGFIWCGSERAWQRLLNGNGIFAANAFLKSYQPE